MLRFSPRPNRAHLVRWREWGEEAFAEAQRQDRPLALFVTAFWCGFCQRLDETSLSHDDAITLLNGLFVPVRVEESQRPDVDLRYNAQGDYPAIVFLTPSGGHLVSVNSLAPEPFIDLLARVADAYQSNREALDAAAAEGQPERDAAAGAPGEPDFDTVEEITGMLEGLADLEHGGFGDGVKHLHAEALSFLLYRFEATGEQAHLDHVLLTLQRLRDSPMFDRQDGGFYRYSSRRDWREPHPEKLLQDQTDLLRLYLKANRLSGQTGMRQTAEGLIDYLLHVLALDPLPAFGGCQDYVLPARVEGEARSGPLQRQSYIDELVYCDANAATVSALLDAWQRLGREDCRRRALELLQWLWREMAAPGGGMHHYWDGSPHVPGLLADAVAMGQACLDAFAANAEHVWLERARELAAHIVERHAAPGGGFYDISEPGPASLALPVRTLPQNAQAALLLTRLGDSTGEDAWRRRALAALAALQGQHRAHGAYAAGYGESLARAVSNQ